jgi:alcohol dehydrogenase class IV
MVELHQLAAVQPWIDQSQLRSVLLVIDREAYEKSGANRIFPVASSQRHVEFDAFEVNPKLPDIMRGLELFRSEPFDAIIAIGGGTAIDVAKSIRCFAAHHVAPLDLVQGKAPIDQISDCALVAVPTTAGTGSEATHFAVVYVDGVKHSVAHTSLLPDAAVLDASLTESLPPAITATTGLDALCQAIESLWSVHSTQDSMCLAEEALGLAWQHLHAAVHTPTIEHRRAMLRAANLAGKAINITKTTGPHALSYAITVNHQVPHGHAIALTLAAFLRFNAGTTEDNVADPRGAEHVRRTIERICKQFGASDPNTAATNFQTLVHAIGCATRLRDVGVGDERALSAIAQSVNAQRLANNPRNASAQDLRDILDSVY